MKAVGRPNQAGHEKVTVL